jgi:thioredoxin reductase
VEQFAGQDVVVVGAGASALDVAKGLLSVGARIRIVARRAVIPFQDPPAERTLLDRVKAPFTVLGPGWRSFLCVEAPLVFPLMPEQFRVQVVQRHLSAAPGWFTREPVEGKAQFLLRREISDAKVEKETVRLTISQNDGSSEEIAANHVIAATGYRVDLARLAFLSGRVRNGIKLCDTSPSLSADFESNIKGLYFVGTAAANSFGPMLRFAAGARFTAARLSRHLAQTAIFALPAFKHAAA